MHAEKVNKVNIVKSRLLHIIGGLTGIGCLLIIISGCEANKSIQPESITQTSFSPIMIDKLPLATPTTPPILYPLTGLASEKVINTRPIMVMVENTPQARPQSGLHRADLVYEILAEGGITRFVAVYQSQIATMIGPVRSIRPYYAQIGEGLDAWIVHAGWSQDAINLITQRKLDHFDEVYGDGAYYTRSKDRKPPHNLYTSIDDIRRGGLKKKFREEWKGVSMQFLPTPANSPKPANSPTSSSAPASADSLAASNAVVGPAIKVTIPYIQGYEVSYKYNAGAGVYERMMKGQPHLDRETGEQLIAANILICESNHRVLDKEGRRAVDVLGPGKGYLVQQGKKQEITWEQKGGIIRAFAEGKELPFKPGQTWIQVVPVGSKLMFE